MTDNLTEEDGAAARPQTRWNPGGGADDSRRGRSSGRGAEVVDHHEVVYELEDWLPEERAQLGLLLDRDGIAHGWEGYDLVVAEVDEDRTEPLLDEVDRSASGVFADTDDGTDDEEEYQASPTSSGRPTGWRGTPRTRTSDRPSSIAVAAVLEWPTPFGLSDEQWWQIKSRSRSVVEAIETGAEADVVATRAGA